MTAPSIKEALDTCHHGLQMNRCPKCSATLSPPDGERREAIARETEPTVKGEMQRIRGLFSVTMDDKEDLITYAKEIVGLRGLASGLVQDEAGIRADEREKQKERDADLIKTLFHPDSAKEAERIAAAIRSARDGGEG